MKKTRVGFGVCVAFSFLQLLAGCMGGVDAEGELEDVGEVSEALVCPPPGGLPPSATASLNAIQPASNAIDGNPATRWESAFADSQEIVITLPVQTSISAVTLNWETACGRDYDIDFKTSVNAPWQRFATIRGNTQSGVVTHYGSGYKASFVRMNGIKRCTQYGFSLWEFGVNVASNKCYPDADGDGHGQKGGAATETCNSVCPAGRVRNNFDCYDQNELANVNTMTWSRFNRGDGSFDYNCSGKPEFKSESGDIKYVCVDSGGKKTSSCGSCTYNFVPIDASDCGQFRCSLAASEYIVCQ
jgi:hypothetical protein